MDTLISGDGEFAEPKVWLFSAEKLAPVAALVESRFGNIYADGEWRR
jgi:hypothetical protein